MTREAMGALLETLVLRIANDLPYVAVANDPVPFRVREAEWAFVKGLASGELMRLRARFGEPWTGTTLLVPPTA